MSIVRFTYKNGTQKNMTPREAQTLVALGRGYLTRDMAKVPAPTPARPVVPVRKSMEVMDRDELHALAREMGVKVHHASGADKVRAAIAESGK